MKTVTLKKIHQFDVGQQVYFHTGDKVRPIGRGLIHCIDYNKVKSYVGTEDTFFEFFFYTLITGDGMIALSKNELFKTRTELIKYLSEQRI